MASRATANSSDAIARDDGDPGVYQAYGLHFLGSTGLLRRSLDATLKAHRLAPGWVVTYITLAVAYTLVDEREAAEQYVLLSTDLGLRPTTAPLCDVRSQLALRAGRFDEARDIIVAGLPPEMGDSAGIEAAAEAGRCIAVRDRCRGCDAGPRCSPCSPGAEAWSQAMKRRFMIWYTQLGALDQSFEVANESLDSDFTWQGVLGLSYGFHWGDVSLVWRSLSYDLKSNGTIADINFSGPALGATFRW